MVTTRIHVFDVDSHTDTDISDAASLDAIGQWSPDGTKIAFTHAKPGNIAWNVAVMDAAGGNPHDLTADNASMRPRGGPDGSAVAHLPTSFGPHDVVGTAPCGA